MHLLALGEKWCYHSLLSPDFITNVCVCITCRDYFVLCQEKGIDDSLLLDDYKIIQIKSKIQYDDYNCGVLSLKVYMLYTYCKETVLIPDAVMV